MKPTSLFIVVCIAIVCFVASCSQEKIQGIDVPDERNDAQSPFGADTPGEAHNYLLNQCMVYADSVGISHYLDANCDLDWNTLTADFDSILVAAAAKQYSINVTSLMLDSVHEAFGSTLYATHVDSVFQPNCDSWGNAATCIDALGLSTNQETVWLNFISDVKTEPGKLDDLIEDVLDNHSDDTVLYVSFDILEHSLDFWATYSRNRYSVGEGVADAVGGILGGAAGGIFTGVAAGVFASWFYGQIEKYQLNQGQEG